MSGHRSRETTMQKPSTKRVWSGGILATVMWTGALGCGDGAPPRTSDLHAAYATARLPQPGTHAPGASTDDSVVSSAEVGPSARWSGWVNVTQPENFSSDDYY